MICTKCYNEFSWRDEKCPTCGAETQGPARDLRIFIARAIGWLTSSTQPVNTKPQFTLKRMFVSTTLMALGVELFASVMRLELSPTTRASIHEWFGTLILLAVAVIGTGAGSL